MLVLVFSQAFWKYNFDCSNLSIKKAAGSNRTKLQSSLESRRDFVRVCWHCPFWFQDHTQSRTLLTWQTECLEWWPNPVWSNTCWTLDTHWASSTYMGITHMDRAHLLHLSLLWLSRIHATLYIVWIFSLRGCLQFATAVPHHRDSWSSFY